MAWQVVRSGSFQSASDDKLGGMSDPIYPLLRRAFFCLPTEASHHLALAGIGALGLLPRGAPSTDHAVECMGLRFPNRVGLAAGLDKDARSVEGFAALGFGSIEVGTVTPLPQPGNPKPRLFRIPEVGAIINRMGFNSEGLAGLVPRLAALRERDRLQGVILGVNIGKNKDTPLGDAHLDYVRGLEAVHDYADYVTLNLSSPNTPGLRTLQSADALRTLLGPVVETRNRLGSRGGNRPLVLKIAPDLVPEDLDAISTCVLEFGIDGVIATNTTIDRSVLPGRLANRWQQEAGGLSGEPLKALSLSTVTSLRTRLDASIPIIGVGGIGCLADARAMLQAGATLVQIYTGFIYRGPELVRELGRLAC